MPRVIALVAAAVSFSHEIIGEGSRWMSPERRQQCLYLRPDLQGQEAFLPTLLRLLERLDTGQVGEGRIGCAERTRGREEVKGSLWIW